MESEPNFQLGPRGGVPVDRYLISGQWEELSSETVSTAIWHELVRILSPLGLFFSVDERARCVNEGLVAINVRAKKLTTD